MHDDPYITLAQAARLCPGKPHPSTVWRWAGKGVNGVHLRVGRQGRRLVTRRSWLDEFTQASARAGSVDQSPSTVEVTHDAELLCAQEGI